MAAAKMELGPAPDSSKVRKFPSNRLNSFRAVAERVGSVWISDNLLRAELNVIFSRRANPATASSALSPIPRRGVFKILRTLTSSSGFETALKYARASLISLRS